MRFRHLRQGLRTFGSREAAEAYGRGRVITRFCSSSRSWFIAWWWLWLRHWLPHRWWRSWWGARPRALGAPVVRGSSRRCSSRLSFIRIHKGLGNCFVVVFRFSFRFSGFVLFPFRFSNFLARKCWARISSCETEGNWYRRGGHGKRFLEDGENDCDADVERLGM